eukprot:TRINITY_DN37148_c0_g2_i1.p1 TRINITY_DN37148_c0_g2~~TRINITY_DN37148_c0_g2_i1.p1  ORF type:complete len:335 (-),score=85.85 TRINITY_DN37148_c0_g2_i1:87-1091(-)
MTITLKLVSGEEVRQVDFKQKLSYEEVLSAIRSFQPVDGAVAKYADEEGDQCTLTKETFGDFAANLHKEAGCVLHVDVPDSSTASAGSSDSDIDEAWERVELEDVKEARGDAKEPVAQTGPDAADEGPEGSDQTTSATPEQSSGALGWLSSFLTRRSEGQEKPAEDLNAETTAEATPEEVTPSGDTEAVGASAAAAAEGKDEVDDAPASKELTCGVCSEQLQLHIFSPWEAWTCDVCHRGGFTNASPMWACSQPNTCDWGMCKDCQESSSSERAPTTQEKTPESPKSLPALAAHLTGALLTAPLFCSASKVFAGRQGTRSSRTQELDFERCGAS